MSRVRIQGPTTGRHVALGESLLGMEKGLFWDGMNRRAVSLRWERLRALFVRPRVQPLRAAGGCLARMLTVGRCHGEDPFARSY